MFRTATVIAVVAASAASASAAPAPASQPASQPTSQPASRPTSQPAATATKPSQKKPRQKKPAIDTGDARDDAIFGGASSDDDASKPKTPSSKSTSQSRDDAILGGGSCGGSGGGGRKSKTEDRLLKRLFEQSNKLQIGGLLYLRFNMSFTDGSHIDDHTFSMPNLVDVYLDARPSDRIRAFVRGRLLYTPTGGQSLIPGVNTNALAAQLNQLWLKFDIARRLYVTIGSQRVLWGTTRLWNPVDFINLTLRPVLSPFDARNGIPMVKLHLPIESLGWNLYAIGVLENMSSLDKGGVVGRAEFVFSTVEIGVIGAYRSGLDPRLGIDWSAGIWDLEVVGELALRFSDAFSHGVSVRTSGGLQYAAKVFDDDMLLVGVEYFYNQQGTDKFNPLELVDGTRQFFYVGRHYASAFISLPKPGQLDNWTFTLSGVGNLSDRSFIGRFDVSYTFLTYITVQAFAVVHFGKQGELRIGENVFPDVATRDAARAAFHPDDPTRRIATQAVDVGLWLSLNL